MHLNHPKTIPTPWSVEKFSSTKLSAKNLGSTVLMFEIHEIKDRSEWIFKNRTNLWVIYKETIHIALRDEKRHDRY